MVRDLPNFSGNDLDVNEQRIDINISTNMREDILCETKDWNSSWSRII